MLAFGDQVPDATVWFAPRETISLRDVVEDRPALFLFYLFDWSKSQREREHGLFSLPSG
jgi:peroxiredoxin